MRQTLLFYIVLFALLPFIRAFRCEAQTNVTFVPDVAAALAQYGGFNESALGLRQRGTNAFDQGADRIDETLTQPWPVWIRHNDQNPHVIHYCYDNADTRNRLNCVLTDAIDRWNRKLNSGVFRDKTNVKFREYNDGAGNPRYCLNDPPSTRWNSRVRVDALRIQLDATSMLEVASATVGYRVASDEGRHSLRMADPMTNGKPYLISVMIVAHEVRQQLFCWKDFADISIACTWYV